MKNIILSLFVLVAFVDIVEGDVALLEYTDEGNTIKHVYYKTKNSPCILKEGTKVLLDRKTNEIIQCEQ